jgi:hypothetical protein
MRHALVPVQLISQARAATPAQARRVRRSRRLRVRRDPTRR